MYEHPKTSDEWNKFSFLNPKEFDWFFKEDFISLAGFVAELLYRWRSNYKSSRADFRQWVHTWKTALVIIYDYQDFSFLFSYLYLTDPQFQV